MAGPPGLYLHIITVYKESTNGFVTRTKTVETTVVVQNFPLLYVSASGGESAAFVIYFRLSMQLGIEVDLQNFTAGKLLAKREERLAAIREEPKT